MLHYMIYCFQQLIWFNFSLLGSVSGNNRGVMCIISFYKNDLHLLLSASCFSVRLQLNQRRLFKEEETGSKTITEISRSREELLT